MKSNAGRLSLCSAVLVVSCSLAGLTGCRTTHGADVVASVNGHAIPRADLDRLFDAQQKSRQDPTPESPEQADSERLEMVRGLIDEEIVEQQAAKMNLTATNDEVDAKIAEFKAHYTDQEFNEYLKQSNQTLDDFRRNVRRSITSTKLFNKEIESKINVTDAEVAAYFNAHKADYNLVENRYHLAQILVTSGPMDPSQQTGQANLQGSKANSDADARKKIQAIKNRVDAGEDFGTLAANFSENPQTAPNGGDMGFPSESQLRADPSTFAAVSKLRAGETTDILPVFGAASKQPIGYVILKLLSREAAGQRDLTNPAVQQSIREQLRTSRSQLLKTAYLEMIRDQAKVENYFADQVFNRGS